jgi:hypothetical protein
VCRTAKCLNFSAMSILRLSRLLSVNRMELPLTHVETVGHFAILGMWHFWTYPTGYGPDFRHIARRLAGLETEKRRQKFVAYFATK